ncbi:MAG: sulfatase, partial [Planctomycetota bacterium]
ARDTLYWHYPLAKPHFLGGRSSGAIRHGQWKLIELFDTGKVELYNLAEDPGEQRNLAESMPDRAGRMRGQLSNWRKSVGARAGPMHGRPP